MSDFQNILTLLKSIWQVVAPFLSVFIALGLLSLRKVFVSQTAFDKLHRRHCDLENTVKNLPTNDEVVKLRIEMSETRGEIEQLRAALMPIDRLTQLLLENEIKDKK